MNPRISTCWLIIQFLVYTSSIVKTERSQGDSDIWRRPPISLVKGGYEGIIVAIHESVKQEDYNDLTDQIKEVMTNASIHLYHATGKSFSKVSILVPSSWKIPPDIESSHVEVASNLESYHRSHIRIRSYDNDSNPLFRQCEFQAEPYVLQPGGCGEESIFIGVTPDFIQPTDTPCWGTPGKALVHMWGHFRWGLFDEYHHSPFNCPSFNNEPEDKLSGSQCTSTVDTKYTEDTDPDIPSELEVICGHDFLGNLKVRTVVPENVYGSIMSVGAHDQIDEFCDTDSQSPSSFHNGNADNRQNRMCRGKSSWEVMRQHLDFSNNETYDFEEPQFTIMVKQMQQTLVLMAQNEIIFQSRTFPMSIDTNELYFLQSLALREYSETVGIILNETHYFTVDLDFTIGIHAKALQHPSIEISEILIFENAPNDLVNGILTSSLNQNVGKFTFIGADVKNFSHCPTNGIICKYSTLSEYLGTIHYDEVETFVRVFAEKGTIPDNTNRRNFTFTLEKGSPDYFPTLRLSWDKGNLSFYGIDIISSRYVDWDEKLIEMRFEEEGDGASVTVTLEKRGEERVTYEAEVFLKPTQESVTVNPFLKSSSITLDDVPNVTIYTSVMKKGKPVLQANVSARLCPPEGPCTEKPLKDYLDPEEFEDGIGLYSAVFNEFSMGGNYSITIKAKGESGNAKWNKDGLQPSGILPTEVDAFILFANPIDLDESFERSPRGIILEVYIQAPSYGKNKSIEFSDVTPMSINVSWPAWDQENDVGSGPVSGYQIQIREAGETDFRAISVGTSLHHLFENLTEDTEYQFRVVIFKDHATYGEGPPSRVHIQRTLPEPPSYGANKSIKFSDVTPTSINVSWPAWDQATDVGSGPVSGHQIQIREAGETDFWAISVGTSLHHLFENLTEDTEYQFRVVISRDHTTYGEGPPSRVHIQRTLPER